MPAQAFQKEAEAVRIKLFEKKRKQQVLAFLKESAASISFSKMLHKASIRFLERNDDPGLT